MKNLWKDSTVVSVTRPFKAGDKLDIAIESPGLMEIESLGDQIKITFGRTMRAILAETERLEEEAKL